MTSVFPHTQNSRLVYRKSIIRIVRRFSYAQHPSANITYEQKFKKRVTFEYQIINNRCAEVPNLKANVPRFKLPSTLVPPPAFLFLTTLRSRRDTAGSRAAVSIWSRNSAQRYFSERTPAYICAHSCARSPGVVCYIGAKGARSKSRPYALRPRPYADRGTARPDWPFHVGLALRACTLRILSLAPNSAGRSGESNDTRARTKLKRRARERLAQRESSRSADSSAAAAATPEWIVFRYAFWARAGRLPPCATRAPPGSVLGRARASGSDNGPSGCQVTR